MKRILINGTMLLALMAVLYLTGCDKPWHRIEGNRDIVTETRSVPSFDKVQNSGVFDVYLIQSDYYEVVLEAESNLLPFIRTGVSGDRLTVDTRDNLKPNYPIKVFIYTPEMEEVKLSGSGLIYSDSLFVEKLDVVLSGSGMIDIVAFGSDIYTEISGSGSAWVYTETDLLGARISGSGDMHFSGYAYQADFNISGSGTIEAYDLPVTKCFTRTSGSGDMYVNVSDYLDVNISGSGSVYYLGTPALNVKITGSGKVIHP
jgi:hypothetical protein